MLSDYTDYNLGDFVRQNTATELPRLVAKSNNET
jgi:hypothetical protein